MKTDAIIYSVLIPIGVVLLANTIVFSLVTYNLVCARRRLKQLRVNVSEQKNGLLHLKAGIAVLIILGMN